MKKSSGHPGQDVRSRHLSFIQANFEMLAAEAYKGFIEKGRGMLVMSDEDFVNKPVGVLTTFCMVYVAKDSQVFIECLHDCLCKNKEIQWLDNYSAPSTMLICFSRTDGGISSYRITGVGEGTPILAYERSKGG